MYKHFVHYSNLDDFYIASEENDGYDYFVPRELWDSYVSTNGLPVIVKTPFEWYGPWFSYDAIQDLDISQRPTDPLFGEMFVFENHGIERICDVFLFYHVRVLQDTINEKLYNAENLESQASRIGLGVAMTTVAVVLSTAMANRLNQRKIEHEFEKIREKREELAKKKAGFNINTSFDNCNYFVIARSYFTINFESVWIKILNPLIFFIFLIILTF